MRCQANKLSKQTRISKGLVLGAGAVAVRCGWCYAGAVPVQVLSKQDKVVKLGAGLSKQG